MAYIEDTLEDLQERAQAKLRLAEGLKQEYADKLNDLKERMTRQFNRYVECFRHCYTNSLLNNTLTIYKERPSWQILFLI